MFVDGEEALAYGNMNCISTYGDASFDSVVLSMVEVSLSWACIKTLSDKHQQLRVESSGVRQTSLTHTSCAFPHAKEKKHCR